MPKLQPEIAAYQALDRVEALESDLAAVRAELEHAQRLALIGTLAAGAAHEVNNLLTPAIAYAQMARGRRDDPAIAWKAIEKAERGMQSASEILRAILDFSIDEHAANRADVAESLQAALQCLGRDPAQDGVTLQSRIEPGCVVAIRPIALQQVFLNLILNAVKAMAGRAGTLTIAAKPTSNGVIRLTVADNGPGIASEIASTLFDPFVSASYDEAATGDQIRPAGSGLGLTICRRLIEAAGGSIEAGETPGGGATFTIELPAPR
jgi:signal transduction histidine kinase